MKQRLEAVRFDQQADRILERLESSRYALPAREALAAGGKPTLPARQTWA
jgi:hypothetical protein